MTAFPFTVSNSRIPNAWDAAMSLLRVLIKQSGEGLQDDRQKDAEGQEEQPHGGGRCANRGEAAGFARGKPWVEA